MTTPATPRRPDEEPLEAARALIDAMLDGHLSDSGVRRLETLVREREDVQRLYVRSVHLRCSIVRHAGPAFAMREGEDEGDVAAGGLTDTMILPAILSAEAADFDEPAPIQLPPMPVLPAEGDDRPFLSRRWVRWSAAAVAAVIVVGLMTAVWFASRPAPRSPMASRSNVSPIVPLVVTPATAPAVAAAPPPAPAVCTVAGQVNAKWDESPLSIGDEMVAGRSCSLGTGLAQLHFVGGADVIVEGPAAFTVGSAGELALRSGKVVATVPGGGFVVRTPEAAITDLGTEFGVNVDGRDGATGVHVFKGRVQAAPAPATQPTSDTAPPPQVLAAGESAAVARHAIERREADPGLEFVRSDEMAARVKAAGGAAYDRWRAFGYEIRRDPALVSYYTFERDAARPNLLANTAPAAGTGGEGTIEGAQWADGRFASKTALHFGGGNDRVKVNLAGRLRSVTLWAWVKVEPLAKGQRKVALLLSDNWQKPGVLHWNVFDTGAVDLGVIPLGGGQQLIRTGQAGAVPIPSGGGWVFVASTCDADGTVRVYCDGEPVGPPVAGQPAEFEIGPAQIGNWDRHYFNSNSVRDDRHFHGSFDELGVLSRAASEGEIKRIYEAGRP